MNAAEHEPTRLTPTQRLHEVTMAALTRAPSTPEHSVTISRNARGVVQCEITVRGFDLDDVLADAERAFVSLVDAHPYPEPATNGAES